MKILVLDVETTTHNNGNPFDERNQLVCIGASLGVGENYVMRPDENGRIFIQQLIDEADVVVGHNFKFDVLWLLKYGFKILNKKLRDTAVVEYILSRQTKKFPALDEVAYERLGERKLDVVKTEYWDYGVQTTDIPWDVLSEYCAKDCELTWRVYADQMNEVKTKKPGMWPIINLSCLDTVNVIEMEWNGQRYDREASLAAGEELTRKAEELQKSLDLYHNVPGFNWNSPKQVGALLFGGEIEEVYYEPIGLYKTGARAGQVKLGKKVRVHKLPRMFSPPKGAKTETGAYSVGEDVLLKLTGGNTDFLKTILELKKIEKEISTYLKGLPQQQDDGHYDKRMIYGQFNQTATATGRLSSSKPNLQNLSDGASSFFISRYS